MDLSEAQPLAMRLLELQQRFEAYVALHEEEMEEIKVTLKELRKDLLQSSRSARMDAEGQANSDRQGEKVSSSGSMRETVAGDGASDGASEASFLTL
jgi:hypothetical protein